MLREIKLTVSQDDKLIETVTKTTEMRDIIKSLEDFQVEANAALTKMIEELGEAGGDFNMDEEDDDSEVEDDSNDRPLSHSEDQNEQSTCKKKKCI